LKKYTEVEGWLESGSIAQLQKFANGKVCLEIGSYCGKSTLIMIEGGALHVTAIDTFRADGSGQNQMPNLTTYDKFMENTSGCNNIEVHVGESKTVVPTLPDNHYDFVFIDGMHSAKCVEEDTRACWPKLKMGGIMAFHDYGWDGFADGGPKKPIDAIFKDELKIQAFAYVTKTREIL
jgi:predicted O-methyltransferase YrrM